MAQRDVTIRISATDNFSQVMQKYNTEMDKAEKNTKDLGKSTDNLAGTLKGLFTIAMAQQVAGIVTGMIELGTEAGATDDRFRALTSTMGNYEETMAGLRRATLGIVDDMHLQAGAMLLVQTAGIETSDELERMMNLITMTKKPSEDMTTAIQNFGLMLANNSILRLDSFGISASKVRARIEELKAELGVDRSEAFRMAVLEEGEKNVKKFGESADVAGTAIARLSTIWENFKQDVAEQTAEGAFGLALGIEFVLGTTPAQKAQQQQIIDETAITLAMDLQEAFDAAMSGGAFGMNEQFIGTFVSNALEMAAQDPSLMNDMDNFLNQIFGRMGGSVASEYLPVMRDILAQSLQIQAANQSERDIAREIADEQQHILDIEIERLAAAEAVETAQEKINRAGQAAGEIFMNVGTAIMDMGLEAAAEDAQEMAKALYEMSLSEMFGVSGGGRLGEIGDMITAAMEGLNKSTESIHNFQTAMDNLSRRNTSSEQLITNVITPTIASIADVDPAQATMMATSLNNIMNEAFLQGISVNSPEFIDALAQQFSATDFQLVDPAQFIESIEPMGEMESSMTTMAEDGSLVSSSFYEIADKTPLITADIGAMEVSMGAMVEHTDKVKDAIEGLSKTKVTIPVQFDWLNIGGIAAYIMPGLVEAIRQSGGIMPGTDSRASTSGNLIRQGGISRSTG